MGFSDQKFYSQEIVNVGLGAVATCTASGSNNLTTVLRAPTFVNKRKLTRFRVEVVTAPAANISGVLFAVRNGTSTLAVATLGTNTVAGNGVWANINGAATTQTDLTQTVTTSTLPNGQTVVTTTRNPNVDIPANTELTLEVIATGTASGHSIGTYDAILMAQDNY